MIQLTKHSISFNLQFFIGPSLEYETFIYEYETFIYNQPMFTEKNSGGSAKIWRSWYDPAKWKFRQKRSSHTTSLHMLILGNIEK